VHKVPSDRCNCLCMAGITLTTQFQFTIFKEEPHTSAFISYYLPGYFIAISSLVAFFLPHDVPTARLSVSSGALISATMFHSNIRAKIPVVSYITEIDKFLLAIYSIIFAGFALTMLIMLLRRKLHRPLTARLVSTFFTLIIVPESILALLYFSPYTHQLEGGPISPIFLILCPFLMLVLYATIKYLSARYPSFDKGIEAFLAHLFPKSCLPAAYDKVPSLLRKPMASWAEEDIVLWSKYCLVRAPQRLRGCAELLQEAHMKGSTLAGASMAAFQGMGMRWGDADTMWNLKEKWKAGQQPFWEDVATATPLFDELAYNHPDAEQEYPEISSVHMHLHQRPGREASPRAPLVNPVLQAEMRTSE